ncbi:ABC1 kinase family protein [Alkalinema pantanalense CENA528]|uniref:ABC1 kinase family protein n=1 Tax=Alkalinema pantanalense TaxID=1620705 RepID=UPI003D6FD8E9
MNYRPADAMPQPGSTTITVDTQATTIPEVPSNGNGAFGGRDRQIADRRGVDRRPEEFGTDHNGLPLRYQPEAIADYYRSRYWQVWSRTVGIFLPLLTYTLGIWSDNRQGKKITEQRNRAIQLRELLTKLGPAFIKIGQAISTRPDLVPPVFLEELSKLQDQIPPFPNEIAFQFIREELGKDPIDLFDEISPAPVAAASLGQVYKATLKTGEKVAVKVQRPGLARSIALDVYILRGLSAWAMRTFSRVRSDLVGIMDEFAGRIFEEMDYTQEGRNAERFNDLYGYLPDIYVPKIYWDYTERRVLTMEWIEGTKLTNLKEVAEQGIDATYLVNIGVQCSLRQLLEHGFFHADPHPGNLLATPDGKLAYLDFGMMSQMQPYQRYGLIEAIVHLVNRDFEGLANDYVKLEFLSPDTDLTPIIPAFAVVFQDALGASVSDINIAAITDKLSALMYEYPFRVPAYFALIIRSLVTLEGIAINVDPEFKVLSEAYPYIAKRLLTDPAPELRTSLKDLLFKDDSFRWNRLENLLRNAKGSMEYDISGSLDQALDFLFSERGEYIRQRLVNEIINSVDTLGQTAWQRLTSTVGARLGFAVESPQMSIEQEATLGHIKQIWAILQETQGFDPNRILNLLPRLVLRSEAQQMGQQIATGLAQRALARFIREVLLTEPPAELERVTVSTSASSSSLSTTRR